MVMKKKEVIKLLFEIKSSTRKNKDYGYIVIEADNEFEAIKKVCNEYSLDGEITFNCQSNEWVVGDITLIVEEREDNYYCYNSIKID